MVSGLYGFMVLGVQGLTSDGWGFRGFQTSISRVGSFRCFSRSGEFWGFHGSVFGRLDKGCGVFRV